jgi:hypothetical protein
MTHAKTRRKNEVRDGKQADGPRTKSETQSGLRPRQDKLIQVRKKGTKSLADRRRFAVFNLASSLAGAIRTINPRRIEHLAEVLRNCGGYNAGCEFASASAIYSDCGSGGAGRGVIGSHRWTRFYVEPSHYEGQSKWPRFNCSHSENPAETNRAKEVFESVGAEDISTSGEKSVNSPQLRMRATASFNHPTQLLRCTQA